MNINNKKQGNSIYKTIMTIIATAIITSIVTIVWIYGSAELSSTESAIGSAAKSSSFVSKTICYKK